MRLERTNISWVMKGFSFMMAVRAAIWLLASTQRVIGLVLSFVYALKYHRIRIRLSFLVNNKMIRITKPHEGVWFCFVTCLP